MQRDRAAVGNPAGRRQKTADKEPGTGGIVQRAGKIEKTVAVIDGAVVGDAAAGKTPAIEPQQGIRGKSRGVGDLQIGAGVEDDAGAKRTSADSESAGTGDADGARLKSNVPLFTMPPVRKMPPLTVRVRPVSMVVVPPILRVRSESSVTFAGNRPPVPMEMLFDASRLRVPEVKLIAPFLMSGPFTVNVPPLMFTVAVLSMATGPVPVLKVASSFTFSVAVLADGMPMVTWPPPVTVKLELGPVTVRLADAALLAKFSCVAVTSAPLSTSTVEFDVNGPMAIPSGPKLPCDELLKVTTAGPDPPPMSVEAVAVRPDVRLEPGSLTVMVPVVPAPRLMVPMRGNAASAGHGHIRQTIEADDSAVYRSGM